MVIISWIAIILFILMALNAGFLMRHKIFGGEWPSNKKIVIMNVVMVLFALLYSILPKSNGKCSVTVIIDNRNSTSEIIIDKQYIYHLVNNEKITLDNLKPYVFIAVKTENEALIIACHDDNHLFKVNHKVNILLFNNQIYITTFPKLSLGVIIDDIDKYDKVIELFKEN